MKDKIKKLFHFLKKSPKPEGDKGPNPYRDWHIVLAVFFLLTASTGFTHYVYYSSHSGVIGGTETPSGPKLKVGQIEQVAKYIKDKQESYEAILSAPLPNIDPN